MPGVPQASALVGRRVYSGSLPTLPHAIHRVSAGDCEAVCENDDSIGQMIADWLKPDWDDEDDFSPDTTSEEDIPSGTQGGIDAMPMAEQNVLARILRLVVQRAQICARPGQRRKDLSHCADRAGDSGHPRVYLRPGTGAQPTRGTASCSRSANGRRS